MKKAFTIKEACQYLGMGRSKLYNLMSDGVIRYRIMPGTKRRRFLQSDLDEYLNEGFTSY